MELGRLKLSLGNVAPHFNEDSLPELVDQVYAAIHAIKTDVALGPGIGYVVTSVNLVKGNAVQIFNQQLRLADQSTGRPALGICLASAAAGSKAKIMLGMGYISGLTGLTANSSYYLDTAGGIRTTKPGAGLVQSIGYALSATELFLTIAQP